ncbi:hypothetical protein B296_00040036, partial [Ensete ventricosum]
GLIMDEIAKMESHLSSAVAFMEGGIQDACDDACSICLEAFCESDPLTIGGTLDIFFSNLLLVAGMSQIYSVFLNGIVFLAFSVITVLPGSLKSCQPYEVKHFMSKVILGLYICECPCVYFDSLCCSNHHFHIGHLPANHLKFAKMDQGHRTSNPFQDPRSLCLNAVSMRYFEAYSYSACSLGMQMLIVSFALWTIRYKESITKSTQGWRVRLFSRNGPVADVGSE